VATVNAPRAISATLSCQPSGPVPNSLTTWLTPSNGSKAIPGIKNRPRLSSATAHASKARPAGQLPNALVFGRKTCGSRMIRLCASRIDITCLLHIAPCAPVQTDGGQDRGDGCDDKAKDVQQTGAELYEIRRLAESCEFDG
jgi:hypothetical protein